MVQPNARLVINAPSSVQLENGRAIARVQVFLQQGAARSPIPARARQSWQSLDTPPGPRPQNLQTPNTVPQIVFTAPGTYRYAVTVADGGWRDRQTFAITVRPANVAPPAPPNPPTPPTPPTNPSTSTSSGPRYRIEAPSTVTLPNSATVQLLPVGNTPQQQPPPRQSWTQVAGPAPAVLRNLQNPALLPSIEFPQPGQYRFQVRIELAAGLIETLTFEIQVMAATNQAPQVNLERERAISLPGVALLQAQVSDDGLPATGQLTFRWQQTSPASPVVVFSDPNAPTTTALFPDKGRYELRFTASDGAATTSDTVLFRVNKVPVVEATAPGLLVLPGHLSLTGQVIDDGLGDPSQGRITTQWAKLSGPGQVTLIPDPENGAIATASFSEPGMYQLRFVADNSVLVGFQDITVGVSRQPLQVVAGSVLTILLGEEALLSATVTTDLPPDFLQLQWRQQSGPAPLTFTTPTALTTRATFPSIGVYEVQFAVLPGGRGEPITDTLRVVVNTAPVIQIESPPSITLPGELSLRGTILSNGLGDSQTGQVQVTWQQISGPGNAVIQGADDLTPTVQFPTPGDYVLELTVNNGFQTARSRILVTANQPLGVDAGDDQALPQPGSINLCGQLSNHPAPRGQVVTQWSLVRGPAAVVFANASALRTAARFPEPGTYQIRLTAQEGTAIATDEVTITVAAACTPVLAGLVSLYTFEEGAGLVVRDRANNGSPMDLHMPEADAKDVCWRAGGGLSIVGQVDLTTQGPATKLFEAVQRTHQLSVEVWFKPVSDRPLRGSGIPIRILSIAAPGDAAHEHRNFTLQQGQHRQPQANFYHARLRTTARATSDEDGVKTPPGSIPSKPVLNHIVYTWNGEGNARLYVDGALLQSESFRSPQGGWGNCLATWDPSYALAIANDPQGKWAGRGEFRCLAFYNRALTPDEVQHNYKAGPGRDNTTAPG